MYLHIRRRKSFDAGRRVAENSINGSSALEMFCNKRVRPVMTCLTVGSRFYNLRVENISSLGLRRQTLQPCIGSKVPPPIGLLAQGCVVH